MATRRSFVIRTAIGGVGVLLVLVPIWFCGCCPQSGTVFEWKYHYRIHTGMTLSEVERVLGPGAKQDSPPGTPDSRGIRPLVEGDQYYVWEQDGLEIRIGFKEGRVYGKYFDAPSL